MSDDLIPPSGPEPLPPPPSSSPSPQAEARRQRMRDRRAPSGVAVSLHPDERIVRTAIISAGIYWKAIVIFGFAIVLMLLFPLVFNLGILFIVVSLLAFILAWLTKHYLLLMLTDRRMVMRFGVLALETVQIHYDKIESVELAWTPMGRFLGYATLVITGTGSRVNAIPFVANAVSLRTEFDNMLNAREDKVLKVQIAPGPPPSAPLEG